jgi:Alcohol dehydrogenase GroES-like domain
MKAVRLLEYGGQLVFNDVPTPTIARDEILVKIKSTAINHLDLVEASGTARQILPIDLPWIPGHEFSGVVEEIGSDVAACAPGDAVFGTTTGMGAYAEYLAVKAAAIARKPSNLSFEEAASVPVASQTALEGIFTHGHLEKGQTILIHGGAGAVGAYAVQLASHAGATVIATASGDDKAYLNSIGANRVIDYREAQREGSAREGRCDLRLDRWRYTEAVVPRLEGRRPSCRCHPARIAGRDREAPCVGRDDEARAVRGRARQNRATPGRGDDTTRCRDCVRAPGCGSGLEGHRWQPARGSWDVAQWAGSGKTQATRQDRASCGLDISQRVTYLLAYGWAYCKRGEGPSVFQAS